MNRRHQHDTSSPRSNVYSQLGWEGARDDPHGARRACVLVDHAGSQLPAHSGEPAGVRTPSERQLRAGARDAPHGARRACVLVDHAGSQPPAHSLRARQPRSRGCASPAHDSYGQEHETLRTARGEHACLSSTPDRSRLRILESPSATEPRMRTFSATHDSHGQEHETLHTARGEHACSSITPDRSCLRILESLPACARPAHDSYGQEHETLRTARGEHACSSITPDRSRLRIL
ncbi:hypothetical protein NFJ02_38g96570 [Pycnococcus provasolii]